MIPRISEQKLRDLARQYKAVAVIGPRQSGKTTLVRATFPDKPYVSLENPDTRSFANEDPRGFLKQYESGAILDEIQRTPTLFSYLQQILDDSDETGLFILSGSNNFLLQENISQTLAGRISYLVLLPFSISELDVSSFSQFDPVLFKGHYPPLWDKKFDINAWYANYLRTYVERDVRQIKGISDLLVFEKFLKLCAGRVGQLLNMSSLAIEVGVDHKTISSWLGVLESSFIVYRLPPYHQNFNKRVVKMSKLYFVDTGLACALLGITKQEQLATHPLRGGLFENFCISEVLKTRTNQAKTPNLYFWRDHVGHEVDLIIDEGGVLNSIEIKPGQTITTDYFKGLDFWNKISGSTGGTVIYAGDEIQNRSNGLSVYPWKMIDSLIRSFSK